jgi:hypothetical protein
VPLSAEPSPNRISATNNQYRRDLPERFRLPKRVRASGAACGAGRGLESRESMEFGNCAPESDRKKKKERKKGKMRKCENAVRIEERGCLKLES